MLFTLTSAVCVHMVQGHSPHVDPCGHCVCIVSVRVLVRVCVCVKVIVCAPTESTFSFTTGWIYKQEREKPPLIITTMKGIFSDSSVSPGTMVPVLILPLLQMSLLTPAFFYHVYSPKQTKHTGIF